MEGRKMYIQRREEGFVEYPCKEHVHEPMHVVLSCSFVFCHCMLKWEKFMQSFLQQQRQRILTGSLMGIQMKGGDAKEREQVLSVPPFCSHKNHAQTCMSPVCGSGRNATRRNVSPNLSCPPCTKEHMLHRREPPQCSIQKNSL